MTFKPEWLRRENGYVEWETPFRKEWKRYADWPAVETVVEAFFRNGETVPDKNALGEREQLPPELKVRPSDVLDAKDPAALGAVISSIKNDTARTVEVVAKNGEATPGT